MSDITIRQLNGHDEFSQCLQLQYDTWGENFTEVASPMIQMVVQKLGGVVAGAFNASGEMIGFVFGMTGIQDGTPVHWSDMLAVRPKWRGKGIGRKLKLFQWDEIRKLGIEVINWTYDPLEARNAHLNLNLLGARIADYIENMYATDEGSPLHAGLGMDRFLVAWYLNEERVERAGRGELPDIKNEYIEAPVINTKSDNGTLLDPGDIACPDVPVVRVEIPASIQQVKQRAMQDGQRWRENTRRVFLHYLAEGYQIVTFYRDHTMKRCYYVITR